MKVELVKEEVAVDVSMNTHLFWHEPHRLWPTSFLNMAPFLL